MLRMDSVSSNLQCQSSRMRSTPYQANVEGMKRLSDSLGTFNESFASWLYIMDMNALTTDWPQAPNDASFELFRRREERDALATLEAARAKLMPPP
ncbi:hypothetical protein MPER_00597 [Moniliophthora perniciosa FA553]|nr:hypothetical protein MPER_00597 [Moniliophthora perniciosa FA553]